MTKLYLCRRQGDEQPLADQIRSALESPASGHRLQASMDGSSVPLGANLVQHIEGQVAQADMLLVLIGPSWLNATDPSGHRRLDDPRDPVRIEIAAALKRGVAVAPVLLNGATLPAARDLPEDIQDLAMRSGAAVRSSSIDSDLQQLMDGLNASSQGKSTRQKSKSGSAKPKKNLGRTIGLVAIGVLVALGGGFLVLNELGSSADKTFMKVATAIGGPDGSGPDAKPVPEVALVNVATLAEHTARVSAVAFSADGATIATASTDGFIKLWPASVGPAVATIKAPDPISPTATIALSADGKTIAMAGSAEARPRVWSMATGQPQEIPLKETKPATALALSSDSRFLLSGAADGSVALLALDGSSPPVQIKTGEDTITALAFTPDGNTLVTASTSGDVKVWSAATHELLKYTTGREAGPTRIALSADGTQLLSAGGDGYLRARKLDNDPIATVSFGLPAKAIAFGPDKKTVIAVGAYEILVWSTETESLVAKYHTSDELLSAAAISPDGTKFLLVPEYKADRPAVWSIP